MSTPDPQRTVYFDNSSTSHPKPECVWEAIRDYQTHIGASPGRAGHALARSADEVISDTRRALAALFNCSNHDKLFFTLNATHALNTIIQGHLKAGDHVITSNLEHNSVLRPLEWLRSNGTIEYTVVNCNPEGFLDPDDFACEIKDNTKLIAVTHGSNVLGVTTPVLELAKRARDAGVKILVDASQTAGTAPVDIDGWGVDFLAFTGHKSLLGPSGTGGFYAKDPTIVEYLMAGGTGNNSHSLVHPESGPHKFEAGTQNYMGIAGLGSAVRFVTGRLSDPHYDTNALTNYCFERFAELQRVAIYGTQNIAHKLPVISFNLNGINPNEVGYRLDAQYGIMARTGLHCAPMVHEVLGTSRQGTVRVSFGYANTADDVDYLVASLATICA